MHLIQLIGWFLETESISKSESIAVVVKIGAFMGVLLRGHQPEVPQLDSETSLQKPVGDIHAVLRLQSVVCLSSDVSAGVRS